MFLRFFCMCLLVIPIVFCGAPAFAREIELTTYYPAPIGEYKNLSSTEGANFATTSGNVGIGTKNPRGILELSSTTSAFYPPRVTTAQRDIIASTSTAEPTKEGAVVYNITTDALEVYDGNKNWKSAVGGTTNATYISDWIYCAKDTSYTITHNLGSSNLGVVVYFKTSSSSTNYSIITGWYKEGTEFGVQVQSIKTTTLKVRTGDNFVAYLFTAGGGTKYTTGYFKVIAYRLD